VGLIALWCGGDMTYFQRKPMPDLWAKFEQEAAQFFADVKAGREPEPFGSPVEVPLLKQMFDKPTGEIINAVEKLGEVEATKLAQRVVDADYQRVVRLAAEKVEEKVKAELLGLLKDADEIELPQGIRVTRTVQHPQQQGQAGVDVNRRRRSRRTSRNRSMELSVASESSCWNAS
jgi:hypothetical protein